MFKLISHAVLFLAGAGAGVYWGVHHPTAAATVSDTETAKIQQAVAAAKQAVLQQVVAEQNSTTANGAAPTAASVSHLNKYQQMLQSAQAEFNAATVKVNGQ